MSRRALAAGLMSIPLGLMGGWLWSVYELGEREKREYERKVRLATQQRLELNLPVDVDAVMEDVRQMDRLRSIKT